jgi:xylose isomerase
MSFFKYSVGPWNVHDGADSYGPAVRDAIPFEEKVKMFASLGFSAIQFHDDDAVPEIDKYTESEIIEKAKETKAILDRYGLKAEFVAPRLWMSEKTIDGGYTSNSAEDREYAMWRTYRSIDIARVLECDKIVLWLAREGTLCYESKSPVNNTKLLLEALNKMLAYDNSIKVMIETKPNEPVDRSACPTVGHALALSAASNDPSRVGILLESAHAMLAGLDPASEIGFAIAMGKLWGVHLNDQNGMKFDQDKSFGVENIRTAFNQIKVLYDNGFGKNGEYIGLDVKAMRTERQEGSYQHLINSLQITKMLEEKVKRYDKAYADSCIAARDYEKLEMYVMELLLRG